MLPDELVSHDPILIKQMAVAAILAFVRLFLVGAHAVMAMIMFFLYTFHIITC